MGIYLNNQNNLFFSLLLCLLLTSYTVNANTEAEYLYQSGLDLYEKGKFEDSIEKLESAVMLEPNIAKYHHILAKGCGRQAESSSWFKAMKLAKKTLIHLDVRYRFALQSNHTFQLSFGTLLGFLDPLSWRVMHNVVSQY